MLPPVFRGLQSISTLCPQGSRRPVTTPPHPTHLSYSPAFRALPHLLTRRDSSIFGSQKAWDSVTVDMTAKRFDRYGHLVSQCDLRGVGFLCVSLFGDGFRFGGGGSVAGAAFGCRSPSNHRRIRLPAFSLMTRGPRHGQSTSLGLCHVMTFASSAKKAT